jgi:hypothetical protein
MIRVNAGKSKAGVFKVSSNMQIRVGGLTCFSENGFICSEVFLEGNRMVEN